MKKKAVEFSLTAEKKEFPIVKIKGSESAADFARQFYHEDLMIYESAFILLTNHASNAIGYAKISQGGVCSTMVDVRIVAKYAIESLASGVIFVHNHPSNNLHPSEQDKRVTKSIYDGLKLFNIRLLDSIILGESGYFSMADEGML